jgi:stress response protein YsnF
VIGSARDGGAASAAPPASGAPREPEVTIPVAEEVAVVEKRQVTTGRVRVATHTEIVEDVVRASVRGETVEVVRVPVNRPVTEAVPQVRTEGNVTIVPVLEEVLVVEKRLVLKEEVHIRRRAASETVELPVPLRRQRAEIERLEES